jgi:hypothetical protein
MISASPGSTRPASSKASLTTRTKRPAYLWNSSCSDTFPGDPLLARPPRHWSTKVSSFMQRPGSARRTALVGRIAGLATPHAVVAESRGTPVTFLLLIGEPSSRSSATRTSRRRWRRIEPRWPTLALSEIRWSDFVVCVVFLALPQVTLTLCNASSRSLRRTIDYSPPVR